MKVNLRDLWLLWVNTDDGFRAFAQTVVERTITKRVEMNKRAAGER